MKAPAPFPSAGIDKVDLLIVAGEASGDEHGSLLLEELLARKPDLSVSALGGPGLESKGASLLFNLVDHSVVGIFEVLKNYGFFKSLFRQTLEWIEEKRPKVVLLVDYPGFNLRLAKALKDRGLSVKGGGEIKVLQYVSPQLWAWKPKRRFLMEKVLDGLAVLFPFELDCYRDVDLPVSFVGHPFARTGYQSPISYDESGPVALLPGSRVQPVERILPCFLDAFELLLRKFPGLEGVVPVPDAKIEQLVRALIDARPDLRNKVVVRDCKAGMRARAVLMSSGTMSLACSIAGIPGVIAYRAHPLTYWLGRYLVKVPYLGMSNLLLPDSPPYQEFLQGAANGKTLAQAMSVFLESKDSRLAFEQSAKTLTGTLAQPHDRGPAEWLLQEGGLG
ncbi:MAG: lipid-A-disaccharide synthase [Opitutae bacterium]|nr:lipid-A-disaccharide synthase [Opitutae bacterium]